ncbi:MAG: DUF3122 domain-containing protein [Microcoleus sp.]
MKKPDWRKIVTIITFCLCLTITNNPPALASIHKYPETGDRVMFRSVQSLRDNQDKAWQVVLYKRVRSGIVDSFNLRLVGFPGTQLDHPVALKVVAGNRELALANDIWSESDLPVNVGEYDFKSIVAQLESDRPLGLNLPVQGKKDLQILVPTFAVREWRRLLDRS